MENSSIILELHHSNARHRTVCFLLAVSTLPIWFWEPLASIVAFSLHGESGHYSHIVLIPFICGYFVYLRRESIKRSAEWKPLLGLPMIAAAATLFLFVQLRQVEGVDLLSLHMLSMVVACWGIFLLCYGGKAFRKASFGLGFLVFMVPLPPFLLDPLIDFLQSGSAEGSAVLFSILDIPVFRQGFVFSLSNLTIHVAEECSGIRSTLALFITSLMAGRLFLRSTWGRLVIASIAVPLAIMKNAFRIVALGLLANYIDPTFITDSVLHRRGGIPLFFLSLVVLFSLVWMMQRIEKRFGYSPRAKEQANFMV